MLNATFADWIGARDLETVMAAFVASGGTLAPVYSAEQILADPQVRARQAIRDVPDDDFGTVRMQAVVPRFRNHPGEVRHAGRAMGHDNDAVFSGMLGLTADERARLEACGVTGADATSRS